MKTIMKDALNTILSTIKPGRKEQQHVASAITSFLLALHKNLKDAKAILGGSGAKGTWLSGNHDIDIFVLYKYTIYKAQSKELSNLLEPILKKSFPTQKIERLHGSRDYFRFTYHDLHFEIVRNGVKLSPLTVLK